MPYYALQLNRLPKLSAEEVLARHDIQVMAVNGISEINETVQRVFLETEQASQSRGSKALSAYSDLRSSRLYPNTRIGLICFIRPCHDAEIKMFSVRCRAFADGRQLGGEAFVTSYKKAKDLALSFIDYGGSWVDADWFENGMPSVSLSVGSLEVPIAFKSNISALKTTELLNLWYSQVAEKLEPRFPSTDVNIGRSNDYERSKTKEMASIWKRLCKECRGLCRLRSKHYTCLFSDSELTMRHIDSSRELRVRVGNREIIKHNGGVTEILRISKTPRGGYIFESTEKVTSVSHLALKFMQDLMRSANAAA